MSKPSLEIALHLLATGLLEAVDAKERGKERWIVNAHLVQALNHICAHQILKDGIPKVGGVHDLYTKARESLSEIEPDFVEQVEADEPLLDYFKEPTWLCEELSITSRDIVGEVQQRVILQIKSLATALGRPELYIEARQWMILHTIIIEDIIEEACNNSVALGLARGHLEKFYEICPVAHRLNLCEKCGRQYEPEKCGRPMCSPWTPPENTKEVFRVNHGAAMYIVRPGLAELWLFDELTKLGLQPELWPGDDAYDLRVEVAGKVLAIDVKDARSAKQLARRLNTDTIPSEPSWNDAYFVLPPWRDSQHYRHALQVNLKPNVPVLWANDLLTRIKGDIAK
ncbi:hypothetical protein [Nostoc sp. CENA543]|uniref:restriction endonuclease-related protein n=1 Tax=Nostoc sp. CENA543 TaxID=1869241 RepID=UPI001CEFA753|nr:hypothetical protein [Nostoc sp. CENA543]